MIRSPKILTALLLVVASATAILMLWSQRAPAPVPAAATTEQPAPGTGDPESANAKTEVVAERRPIESAETDEDVRQGLHGRVTRLDGTPVEGASLVLFESYYRSPFEAHVDAQRGVIRPPIAQVSTDSFGRFSIGVRRVAASGYELLASHPDLADQVVPNLSLFSERWIEIADVRLDVGVSLEGRVSVQGANGLPVAAATVAVSPSGLGSTLRPMTQRQRTRSVETDSAGFYRLEHCPVGLVDVTAVAPNFARVRRSAVPLERDLINRVDFELPKGFSISGVVLDENGTAIGGASIDASALDARAGYPITTRADADGRFELIGLVDAPYQLRAWATGYVREERKPVRPGVLDEAVVLRPQGAVEIVVLAPDGRPVTRFDAEIKAYHESSGQLHSVTSARIHRVVPDALSEGRYTIGELDPGNYVVQIRTRNWAKTFSERFTIEQGDAAPRLTIELLEGGLIEGSVLDQHGRPLAGVSVRTLDSDAPVGPLAEIFANLLAERTSLAQTYSDIDGRFELPRLAPGSYRLRLEHPEHAGASAGVIEVLDGQVHPVGSIKLQRGATVSGVTALDGAPAGQIQVTISSLPNADHPEPQAFRAETTSDDSGRFRLPRRLPPGRYQARAARQTLDSPLLKVVDFTNTRQDFRIAPGQESLQLHFSLTSN